MTSHNNVKRDFLLDYLTTICGILPWGTVRGHRVAVHTPLATGIGASWCAVWAEALRGREDCSLQALLTVSIALVRIFCGQSQFRGFWRPVTQCPAKFGFERHISRGLPGHRHSCQCKRTFWLPHGDRKYNIYSSGTAICQPLAGWERNMWSVIVECGVKLGRMRTRRVRKGKQETYRVLLLLLLLLLLLFHFFRTS